MDLLSGLVTANAPIGQQNGVGSYIEGNTAGQASEKARIENENAQYTQDLTTRLQKALEESIGDNGLPDPVKLKAAGAKYNISAQTIQYSLDNYPKFAQAGQTILKAKRDIAATAPEAEKELTKSWTNRPAGSTQSSSKSAAVPTGDQSGATSPTDIDTQTNSMATRATAWGKGSPTTAAIQKQIGLTGSDVDGTWGPKTTAAYKAYLANNPKAGVVQAGNKLQFLQDQTANPNLPATGDQGTGNGAIGTQTNPAPYVEGAHHYNDTYYGFPTKDGMLPLKGKEARPATGNAVMGSQPDLDDKATAMATRASAWGKGSPETASIQKEIGLTGSDVDGTWGPKTTAAYRAYIAQHPNADIKQVGNQLQFVGGDNISNIGNPTSPTFISTPPEATEQTTGDPFAVPPTQAPVATTTPTAPEAAPKNYWDILNKMEPDLGETSLKQETVTNPIQIASLDPKVQDSLLQSLRQGGLLGPWTKQVGNRDAYLAKAQDVLDSDLNRQVGTLGYAPTKQMFVGPDGSYDNGAYLKAKSDYEGKKEVAVQAISAKYGKAFGDMFAQKLQTESNARANEANARTATEFGHTQASLAQIKKDYPLATEADIPKIRTLLGAKNSVDNSIKAIEQIRSKSKTLSDDEFNAQLNGTLTSSKNFEGINTMAGTEEFMSTLRKDKSFGEIASQSADLKDFFHRYLRNNAGHMSRSEQLNAAEKLMTQLSQMGQVESQLDAYKNPTGGWRGKKAKPRGASNPKPNRSTAGM